MEEKKKSKWLMGCGIGCGAIIVILIIAGIVGYNFFKSKFGVYQELEVIEDKLVEQYGALDEYCPPPDGVIPVYRIERFVRIRQSMQEAARRFSTQIQNLESLDSLDTGEEKPSLKTILRMVGGGFDFASEMGHYYKDLYNALLLNEMGLGEYLYLYALGYHSYLGSLPDTRSGEEAPVPDMMKGEDFRELHQESLLRMNRHLLKMVECQLNSIPEETEFKTALSEEVNKMKKNPVYLPWQDGLPARINEAFDPYRDSLQETLYPEIRHFEIFFSSFGKGEHKGFRFNFND